MKKNNPKPKSKIQWLVILEWIIYLIIICKAINAVGLQTRWWYTQRVFPGDFVLYLNAALGNFLPGFIYKEFMAFVFIPFTWTPDSLVAYTYYCAFQTTAFLLITHKMFEIKWGWVFILIAIPSFHDLLQVGNIQIILSLLSMFIYSSIFVILIKPYLAIYPICKLIKERIKSNRTWGKLNKQEWIYLSIILCFGLLAIPTARAMNYALNEGKFLERSVNLILLAPMYYIIMKKEK
jgi:hypothetical protein